MTLTSEQLRERMVDYLYEMLEGDELRSFESHLQASAEARHELAALQRTLRKAREGLAQAADAAPPARVRSAVLLAAQDHMARNKPETRKAEVGFWKQLRTGWLVPALGVAAAAALMVFGRNIKSPRVATSPVAQEARAAAPSATPPSAAASASQPAPVQEKTARPTDAAPERARAPSFAAPPPAWVAKRARATRAERQAAETGAPAAVDARGGRPEREAVASEDKASAQPAQAARDDVADSLGSVVSPALAKPSAPASSGMANAIRESSDAPESALVRRAQTHIAAKRWREAEADYRELLRRYPNDARVASWKKQIALAERALRDTR